MRAVVSLKDGIILVHVLRTSTRKEGAADDAYVSWQTTALQQGNAEAIQVVEQLLQQLQLGISPKLMRIYERRTIWPFSKLPSYLVSKHRIHLSQLRIPIEVLVSIFAPLTMTHE